MSEQVLSGDELVALGYADSAQGHASRDSRLIVLDRDPSLYGGQTLESYAIPGTRKPASELRDLVVLADPLYGDVIERFQAEETKTGAIAQTAEKLAAGKNVTAWIPHGGTLTGPGETGLGFREVLELLRPDLSYRSHIILGKLLGFMGYKFAENVQRSCVESMRDAFDTVFLTMPPKSAEELGVPEVLEDRFNKLRHTYNGTVIRGLIRILNTPEKNRLIITQPGNLTFVTPNGTTNDAAPTDEVTLKLFGREKEVNEDDTEERDSVGNFILPIFVSYRGDERIVIFDNLQPATIENCRASSEWLVEQYLATL